MFRELKKSFVSMEIVGGKRNVDTARIGEGAIPRHASRYLWVVLAVLVQTTLARGDVITMRTGQLGPPSAPNPGACPALDYNFTYYAQITPCPLPISPVPFGDPVGEFWHACTGPQAKLVSPYSSWTSSLPSDPDARWINWSRDAGCMGTPAMSVLYCAKFDIPCPCSVADSVKICWMVDDVLGDPPGDGGNPGGIYINEISIAPFSGGNSQSEQCGVAYNVPINTGLNDLHVYQRDTDCAVSGVILSCSVYYHCGPVPVEEKTWGSIKSLYR